MTTKVLSKKGQVGGHAGGGGAAGGGGSGSAGQRGRKEILPGAELIKCIYPNEGEPLRWREGGEGGGGREGGREEGEGREGKGGEWRAGGWEGVEGRGRGGGSKFYQGAELIKCIDPNEGEALSRGSREGRADGRECEGGGGGEGGRGGGAGQREILPGQGRSQGVAEGALPPPHPNLHWQA